MLWLQLKVNNVVRHMLHTWAAVMASPRCLHRLRAQHRNCKGFGTLGLAQGDIVPTMNTAVDSQATYACTVWRANKACLRVQFNSKLHDPVCRAALFTQQFSSLSRPCPCEDVVGVCVCVPVLPFGVKLGSTSSRSSNPFE